MEAPAALGIRGAVHPNVSAGFGELVKQSSVDSAAAYGLAFAYADLPRQARRRLVDAVVAEVGAGPSAPLALLLSVETDPRNAEHLVRAIGRAGDGALRATVEAGGYVCRDDAHDAAFLIRPLWGPFVEVFGLRRARAGGDLTRVAEPLLTERELPTRLRELGVPVDAPRVSYTEALDAVVRLAWAERQFTGAMPRGLERLAALC